MPTAVHAFTDGRDTSPRSATEDIGRLAAALPTPIGIAMDRDRRWDRVAKAYDAIADAEGPRFETAKAIMRAISPTNSSRQQSSVATAV